MLKAVITIYDTKSNQIFCDDMEIYPHIETWKRTKNGKVTRKSSFQFTYEVDISEKGGSR